LAGITLRCRNEHAFVTRAQPGNTVACPACRAEGRGRVSCRVPKRAAGLDGRQAPDDDSARLDAAWALEQPPAAGALGDDAGQPCGKCGGPMYWTAAHTAVMCPACPAWSVSPSARSRAAAHGQALERREARSRGEVAVRSQADEAAARAARVRIRGQREAVLLLARQLEAIADPDAHDRSQYQRAAFEIRATLRGYGPEISTAGDEATLAAIAREIVALRDSPQFRELAAESGQAAARREGQQYALELAAAAEARQAEEQRQAETAEQQRQAEARRAVPETEPVPAIPRAGIAGAVERMVAQRRQARDHAIAANGACGFRHTWADPGTVPAARLYGIEIQTSDGLAVSGQHASIRACSKHFGAAEQWMAERGYPDCTYWEL
jgi:hypothetical protein